MWNLKTSNPQKQKQIKWWLLQAEGKGEMCQSTNLQSEDEYVLGNLIYSMVTTVDDAV